MPSARLLAVEPLNATVQRLLLEAPGFAFAAGQYLVIQAGDRHVPLSIASAPERLPELELHYASTPGDPDAAALDACLATATTLDFDGPGGNVTVTGPTPAPLTLIAGGTGIAQAAAIVEHLSSSRQERRVLLVRSVAAASDAYPIAALEQARSASWFDTILVIDDPGADASAAVVWIRRAATLPSARFILSGGPGFVYACADALAARGVLGAAMASDVFDYAPREEPTRSR
jgi:CDP-4-dehydro-6-deoxyglucose reductase